MHDLFCTLTSDHDSAEIIEIGQYLTELQSNIDRRFYGPQCIKFFLNFNVEIGAFWCKFTVWNIFSLCTFNTSAGIRVIISPWSYSRISQISLLVTEWGEFVAFSTVWSYTVTILGKAFPSIEVLQLCTVISILTCELYRLRLHAVA